MTVSKDAKEAVSVAYSGVHSIYHIAHAAHENQLLDRFFCSVADTPSKWGGALASLVGADRMVNRRRREIPARKIAEYPWPLLKGALGAKFGKKHGVDWLQVNDEFDSWVASKLQTSSSQVFVGVETCALRSFEVGRRQGMKLVLDCPQLHPAFLAAIEAKSAAELGLPEPASLADSPMERRKQEEFAGADLMLMLSDVQKQTFVEQGFDASKMAVTFFWPDTGDFFPPPPQEVAASPALEKRKLRVLFVGSLSLRKGITYLLRAVKECALEVELTMVGPQTAETEFLTRGFEACIHYVTPITKMALRDYYWRADVLVMPSIAEAYGWVAMEAMACGTPVIVSQNCGAPVPDEAWRVPMMDSDSIAARLQLYARDGDLCREDGRRASEFARGWTPQAYRAQIAGLLGGLLG